MGLTAVKTPHTDSTQRRALGFIILLALAAAGLSLAGDSARLWLRFEADAHTTGEWWRWLTAHIVHLGYTHAALNVAGLGLMFVLFAPLLSATDWVIGTGVSALIVSLGLVAFSPAIVWYVGLSGVLHGLFVLGVVAMSRSEPMVAIALALGLLAKLVWEQAVGPVPGSELTAGGPVIVDAHLYGAIGGWLASLVSRLSARASNGV